MNWNESYRLLDEISQEHSRPNVNLWPGILARVQKERGNIMKPKRKLTMASLLTAITVATLFFTVPGVASATRKILGFIPGIGLIDQTSPLRILAEPVTDTRDGYTVTVENAVLDQEHTVITYSVEGPFTDDTNITDDGISEICFAAAELHLPDGIIYQIPGGLPDSTWETGYRVQYSYPAIPAGVDQAMLYLPCLNSLPFGKGPENWEISLSFILAPAEMTVYPVGIQATPTSDPEAAETEVALNHGINISLESIIPLTDSQLVQVRADWQNNPNITWIAIDQQDVNILDTNGNEVTFTPSSEAIDPNAGNLLSAAFGFKTSNMDAAGSAKVVITSIKAGFTTSASISFDPGSDRQPGQVYEVNQDLKIDGHMLHIRSIEVSEMGGNASLTVNMESTDGILNASIVDNEHPIISGGSSEDGNEADPVQSFWSSMNYDGGLPEGLITLTVSLYTTRVEGPWIVEWTPVATSSTTPDIKPEQTVCLTQDAWNASLSDPLPVPDELNGMVLIEQYDEETLTNHLSLTRLDGSDIIPLVDDGADASISPDGKKMVYANGEGKMLVYDFESGESEPLDSAEPNSGIVRLYWSPDGQQIGFTGTPDGMSLNIFLANLDGSGVQLLNTIEPIKLMQGWLPDQGILYVTMDENGPVLKIIDPLTGVASTLFNVPQLATAIAVSEGGERLALNWVDQSAGTQTVFAFTPDGSQRKTLLEMNSEGNIRNMVWSPDGAWLLVDFSWKIPDQMVAQALIQVDTCQIIPLTNLKGEVLDWLP
jgi:Tol biopolymer transport system component